MNRFFKYATVLVPLMILGVSCKNEWEGEQYRQYVSFKAPIDSRGVTPIYIRYQPAGEVTYQLPLIVSGSTINEHNLIVRVAIDTDTLAVLNQERFSTRKELYYKPLESPEFFTFEETVTIPSGKSMALLPIKFTLDNLDLVEKWVVPLSIESDESYNYLANPRKNYSKALLRVYPFNDFSGEYSATRLNVGIKITGLDQTQSQERARAYVVDENAIFFYAGLVDEERMDRKFYKVYVRFNEVDSIRQGVQYGSLTVSADASVYDPSTKEDISNDFVLTGPLVDGVPSPRYEIFEEMDELRPYLKKRFITIYMDYEFTDKTSSKALPVTYTVSGSLIMERQTNIQIPDEDQAILW